MANPGNQLRRKVAIVGAADTEVGVLPGRTPMELCVEAALAAVADPEVRHALSSHLTPSAHSVLQSEFSMHESMEEKYHHMFQIYQMPLQTTTNPIHHARP